jgi:hypothetical protein
MSSACFEAEGSSSELNTLSTYYNIPYTDACKTVFLDISETAAR